MSRRLERSRSERMVAGVCGGIAEYLDIDPTIVRVAFALAIFPGIIGIFAYILLAIVMPQPAAMPAVPGDTIDPGATAPVLAAEPADPERAERRRASVGFVLIALGAVFLLNNAGVFRFLDWRLIWPVVLIGLGGLLLLQRARS